MTITEYMKITRVIAENDARRTVIGPPDCAPGEDHHVVRYIGEDMGMESYDIATAIGRYHSCYVRYYTATASLYGYPVAKGGDDAR